MGGSNSERSEKKENRRGVVRLGNWGTFERLNGIWEESPFTEEGSELFEQDPRSKIQDLKESSEMGCWIRMMSEGALFKLRIILIHGNREFDMHRISGNKLLVEW
jgi:hypothetical protein